MRRKAKAPLTDFDKEVRLSWELLEHKLNYYHHVPVDYLHIDQVSDREYDLKEAEYVRLRRLREPDFVYSVVGFPFDTASGKLILCFAREKYRKKHGKDPEWRV